MSKAFRDNEEELDEEEEDSDLEELEAELERRKSGKKPSIEPRVMRESPQVKRVLTPLREEKIKEVESVDITTQTAKAFKLPGGEIVNLEEYLVWMGNEVYRIRRAVA